MQEVDEILYILQLLQKPKRASGVSAVSVRFTVNKGRSGYFQSEKRALQTENVKIMNVGFCNDLCKGDNSAGTPSVAKILKDNWNVVVSRTDSC